MLFLRQIFYIDNDILLKITVQVYVVSLLKFTYLDFIFKAKKIKMKKYYFTFGIPTKTLSIVLPIEMMPTKILV